MYLPVRIVLVAVFGTLLLAGCKVQFVAPYDESAFEEILQTAKQTDLFYAELLETSEDERGYAQWRDRYIAIEADMRSLWLRNAARDDNRDSEQIMQDILGEWSKYRERHANRDTYSNGNLTLDRDRLARMFIDAARAETAKQRD